MSLASDLLQMALFLGLLLFLLQLLQGRLPLNPQGLPAVPPLLALNTAVSFMTNTNWQAYGGESTMSYLTQMAGLTVQNILSAATGIAVALALTRGLARRSAATLGNFWVDLTRAVLWVLLPLSLVLGMLLVGQGVPQNLRPYVAARTLEGLPQVLPMGPVASQEAIKELGTNGGGFFNANSAHPFENPSPLTNLLEMLGILVIPVGLTFTFGRLVGDRRQGWALLGAMALLFVLALGSLYVAERAGNPLLAAQGVAPPTAMEGTEVRFGLAGSALFATATTAASCGAVNTMHDSLTPLGGLVAMVQIMLGEVVFGGVGAGLYGMLVFVLLTVFVLGLMVGRTPEYLGKKIEAREMKLAVIAILLPSAVILLGAALAVGLPAGRAALLNAGPHGLSEALYAAASAGGNNGSAFAGLSANTAFYNLLLALVMLVGRFGVIVPGLALERMALTADARRAELLAQTEQFRQSLLDSVSHDLRTPLATVIGAATSYLESGAAYDEAGLRHLLESIRDEAQNMNALIEKMLDMARVESGALSLAADWCEVQDLVGTAVAGQEALLAGRELRLEVPDDLPLVRADFVLLARVLANLVDNAVKYSPAGTPVTVTARVVGGEMEIAVLDRGPGIPAEERENVLRKFYRLKTPGAPGGTGLGLSICRGIVQAHGGRLWLEAREGGGTRAAFTLPRGQAQPGPVPEKVDEEEDG